MSTIKPGDDRHPLTERCRKIAAHRNVDALGGADLWTAFGRGDLAAAWTCLMHVMCFDADATFTATPRASYGYSFTVNRGRGAKSAMEIWSRADVYPELALAGVALVIVDSEEAEKKAAEVWRR